MKEITFRRIPKIKAERVVGVPWSRRGGLTANNLISIEIVLREGGEPQAIEIYKIPRVPVLRYLQNLMTGLSPKIQRQMLQEFNALVGHNMKEGVLYNWEILSKPAETLVVGGEQFGNFIDAICRYAEIDLFFGEDNADFVGREKISLGDAFSIIDRKLVEQVGERLGMRRFRIDIISPSRGEQLFPPSRRVEISPEELGARVFQKELLKGVGKKIQQQTVRAVAFYILGEREEFRKAVQNLGGGIRRALENNRYRHLKTNLGVQFEDNDELIERSIEQIFREEGFSVPPGEKGWELLDRVSVNELGTRLARKIIEQTALPALVLRAGMELMKPKTLKAQGEHNYVTGKTVLAKLLEMGVAGRVIVMQDFGKSERRDPLPEVIAKLRISPSAIKAFPAPPEEDLPYRDCSPILYFKKLFEKF